MQHPHILSSNNRHQHSSLHMSNLHKAWLKCQNIRIEHCKRIWCAFPGDNPLWSGSPSFSIYKERIICVTEQELGLNTFNVNRLNVFFPLYEIKRCICL